MMIIPRDQLERRRPVWEGMSAFFLDTELDDSEIREIARTFSASGYTESQLLDILTTEVAPLLYPSLCFGVSGVWGGFDIDWIERDLLAGKHRILRRWYNFAGRWMCSWMVRSVKRQYWFRVLPHLRAGETRAET